MTSSHQLLEKNQEKKKVLPLAELPAALVSRRWWWATLLVLAGVMLMGRLGIWQLDRLDQRRAANAAYLQQINQPPIRLSQDLLNANPDEMVDRQAIATGAYDFSSQLILVQQNYQGRPGAHLVTPLLFDEGRTAVLVDRGWIPVVEVEDSNFDRYELDGPQNISGVIQKSQTLDRGRESIVQGYQQEWYRIDIGAIEQLLPYDLLPFYLLESPGSEFQDKLPYKIAMEVDLSEGPHLGYAIQWFLFSTILAIGYLYFVRTRTPVPGSV